VAIEASRRSAELAPAEHLGRIQSDQIPIASGCGFGPPLVGEDFA